jgi:hypothetical protein
MNGVTPKTELEKLMEEMKLAQGGLGAGSGELKPVEFGSSLAADQLKAQTQGPSLEIGKSPTSQSDGISQAAGEGITKGLGEAATGIAKAQFIGESAQRKLKAEAMKEEAEGRIRASKAQAQGAISPLRSLIANYKAALS